MTAFKGETTRRGRAKAAVQSAVPITKTSAAFAELDAGKGKRFKTAEALFDDLGI